MKTHLKKSNVYVVRVDNPKDAMSRLFKKLELPKTCSNIAIKINMCYFRPIETGAVTDPSIVRLIINQLQKRYQGIEISLVEHDASTARADLIFRMLGFDDLAKEMNVKLVNVRYGDWVDVKIKGSKHSEISIPKVFDDADLVISHPKLKTHSLTRLTCSLKNMYGCFKPWWKLPYHKIIDDVIVDFNLGTKAGITIVDANICHEGFTGPSFGTPKKLGLFIGGNDQVAVDSFCGTLIGSGKSKISHVVKAEKYGIGTSKYNLVTEIPLEELKTKRLDFNERKLMLVNTLKRIGANIP